MSKKQRIKDQIKSLKDLIKDLEFQLAEEEDVGKTSEQEKDVDPLDDIRKKIEEIEKSVGPVNVPWKPQQVMCQMCGQFVYGNYHICETPKPWTQTGWRCGCGQWVGSMQVHTCPWNPGITCITYG